MTPIQRLLKLDRMGYHVKHLTILNTILPMHLTEKEVEVLAAFMSLDSAIIKKDMFNTVARKEVREKLQQSPGGLGNHLKSMIAKGVIDKDEITKQLTVKEFLIPNPGVQYYKIKLENNEREEN